MYYRFAFQAIAIALSASGVYVFLRQECWRGIPRERLLTAINLGFDAAVRSGAL